MSIFQDDRIVKQEDEKPAPQPERNIEAEALEYIFGANLDWLRIVDEKLTPPWPRECHIIAMGMRHVSQAAPSQDAGALAQLRHLYANMVGGAVRDADGARRIAKGILGPAIERLEHAARIKDSAPSQDAEDAAHTALVKVLNAIQRYLPPDGVTAHDTLTEIIGVVDPWPLAKPWRKP